MNAIIILSVMIRKKVLNFAQFSETIYKYVIKAENMSSQIKGLHSRYPLIMLSIRMCTSS